jgi:hypothetical protein
LAEIGEGKNPEISEPKLIRNFLKMGGSAVVMLSW